MKKHQSIPLFENPFLEKLTHVHPLLPLLFWTPVILCLIWRTFLFRGVTPLQGLFLVIVAPLSWTLVEYLLHRFFFHFEGKGPISQRIIYIFHGIHHDDPHDATRLVMPIVPGVLYALLLFGLFRLFMGAHLAEGFLAFFLIGYLCYDYIHYSIHHFVPKTNVGRYLRKSHLIHHVHSHTRFGVSSPLWDYLLNTLDSKKDPA